MHARNPKDFLLFLQGSFTIWSYRFYNSSKEAHQFAKDNIFVVINKACGTNLALFFQLFLFSLTSSTIYARISLRLNISLRFSEQINGLTFHKLITLDLWIYIPFYSNDIFSELLERNVRERLWFQIWSLGVCNLIN
jgi:hypothetical protein